MADDYDCMSWQGLKECPCCGVPAPVHSQDCTFQKDCPAREALRSKTTECRLARMALESTSARLTAAVEELAKKEAELAEREARIAQLVSACQKWKQRADDGLGHEAKAKELRDQREKIANALRLLASFFVSSECGV